MSLLSNQSFETDDLKSKRTSIFTIISLIAFSVLFVVTVMEYQAAHVQLAVIEGASVIIIALNLMIFRTFLNLVSASFILVFTISFVSIITLYIEGFGKESSLFWTASLPIYIFLLLDSKRSLYLSIFNMLFILLITLNSIFEWSQAIFDIDVLWQVFFGYIAISYVVWFFEKLRSDNAKALDAMVRQRDTLLQEVNHRVKNNMQIIISLLRLQSDRCGDEVKDIVAVAENRIRSMLAIHELLYKGDVEAVDTYVYIDKLTQEIVASFTSTGKKILLDITNENLPMDVLVQSGFIINELVTNAIKYAKNPKGLEITITLQVEDKYVVLEVKDNGVNKKASYSPGLGMIFVRTIVEDQFSGHLDIGYDEGTVVKAVFSPEG